MQLKRLEEWSCSSTTRCRLSGQFHAPSALPLEIDIPVLITLEAVRVTKPVWMLWSRNNVLPLPEIEPRPFSPQPVAITPGLSYFYYVSMWINKELNWCIVNSNVQLSKWLVTDWEVGTQILAGLEILYATMTNLGLGSANVLAVQIYGDF
jgi:hypothetical protein